MKEIKLLEQLTGKKVIFKENEDLLIPRRSKEEREKNHVIAINKQIQEYIKNGSKGDLDLSNSPIEKLPDSLIKVGGDLRLKGSKIKDLNNLEEVNGSIELPYSNIESLGKLKKVKYDLWAFKTLIRELPDNLTIGGWLDLRHAPIDVLPKNLTVVGQVYLAGTPISKQGTLLNKYKQHKIDII